jgi:hypothetical protein
MMEDISKNGEKVETPVVTEDSEEA